MHTTITTHGLSTSKLLRRQIILFIMNAFSRVSVHFSGKTKYHYQLIGLLQAYMENEVNHPTSITMSFKQKNRSERAA